MVDESSKYIERTTMDRKDQLRETDKPKPPRKEGKSPFDELLEQSRQMQQGSVDTKLQANKTVTQQAVQEIEKHQEKTKDQSRDRDKKEEEHQQSTKGERTETGFVGRKIVGKTGLRQQQGESGGKGSEGGPDSKRGEKALLKTKKWSATDTRVQDGIKQFGKQLQAAMSKAGNAVPKTISQEVLNQLVQYVRLGLSREGGKEIELQLHEKVFKGLRLRLSSNHGKVEVHFMAATAEVRELFTREASRIKGELIAKGVAVETIQVS